MYIEYKDTQDFSCEELEDLFLSVDWSSGHYPDKLVIAMKNFKTIYSAWDEGKLIGMICAMDDHECICPLSVSKPEISWKYGWQNFGSNDERTL